MLTRTILLICLFSFMTGSYSETSAEGKIGYDSGLQKILEYNKAGNFQGSEDLLKEMLSQYPDNSELLSMLANVLFWGKKYDESLTVYKRLVELKPSQQVRDDMNRVVRAKERQAEKGQEDDIESLIISGEISKAKETLNSLPEERREKLYSSREDLYYRARKNYLMLGGSAVNYDRGYKDEKQFEVRLGQRIAGKTFVFSYAKIDRFGLTDNEAGLEMYSKLGEKTKRWWYIAMTASTETAFLPRWTLSGSIYQGYGDFDFSLGYAHQEYKDTGVDRITPGVIVYLPHGFAVHETLFVDLKKNSTALLSKVNYEPNHKWKGSYSYSFGKSAEQTGRGDEVQRIRTHSHGLGIEYRFREYISIGAEYKLSRRQDSYTQSGFTLFTRYWW